MCTAVPVQQASMAMRQSAFFEFFVNILALWQLP